MDGMEVARAAGYLLLHVFGLVTLSQIAVESGDARAALEYANEAQALYGRRAPESTMMLKVHRCLARAHSALGEHPEAFASLTRAHNLARETANRYMRACIDAQLGRHFLDTGDVSKAVAAFAATAPELGNLGAKYDVALVRLWHAEALWKRCMAGVATDRDKDVKLARSNAFEARRLFESMHASKRLDAVIELEKELESDAKSHPPTDA
jgi:ATP/maltotriose-dependent transcriptional regulator MalT